MNAPLRVYLAGATGWAGKALLPAILEAPDLRLVAVVARRSQGRTLRETLGMSSDLSISGSVLEALQSTPADVFFDYTSPEAVRGHVETALEAGAASVIGTSGRREPPFPPLFRPQRHRRVHRERPPRGNVGGEE